MSDTLTGVQPPKSPAKSSGSSPYKVYRQGFLLKSPARAVRKKLHRYWFVLFKQKDMLAFLYFQDEDHYLERKKNEGFFRIDDLTSIDVIPEHMGRKNAFCIATPRAKYHLVSESRYELHHWLLALHGAIEDYKNSTAGRNTSGPSGKKKTSRGRAQSTTTPPTSLSKGQSRIKPSRPAPRAPPKDKKKGDEENIPPLNLDDQRSTTTTVTTTTTTSSSTHEEDQSLSNLPSPTTNNLDNIVAGLLQESNEQGTLDYTLTEDEYLPIMANGDHNHEETGSMSTSMPNLNDKDNTTEESTGNSDENASPPPSHMRHLSFSSSLEFSNKQDGKRRSSKKRSGSIKGRRSISPPNLPPPPPPPTTEEEQIEEYTGENVINSFEPQDVNIKHSPKPPIPARTTSLNINNQTNEVGEMQVRQYLDEAFNEEDDQGQHMTDGGDRKSPGILRKHNNGANTKRTVAFEESVKGRYEPMVDHESLPKVPNIVAATKLKLFGSQESESFKYNRTHLQNQSNVHMEPQDELLEAIESALQPTSYMEQGNQTNVGFSAEVGPPSIPLPDRPPQDYGTSGRYSLETSPKEFSTHEPQPMWTNPTFDDTPTTTTFASNQDTMYRSIV